MTRGTNSGPDAQLGQLSGQVNLVVVVAGLGIWIWGPVGSGLEGKGVVQDGVCREKCNKLRQGGRKEGLLVTQEDEREEWELIWN